MINIQNAVQASVLSTNKWQEHHCHIHLCHINIVTISNCYISNNSSVKSEFKTKGRWEHCPSCIEWWILKRVSVTGPSGVEEVWYHWGSVIQFCYELNLIENKEITANWHHEWWHILDTKYFSVIKRVTNRQNNTIKRDWCNPSTNNPDTMHSPISRWILECNQLVMILNSVSSLDNWRTYYFSMCDILRLSLYATVMRSSEWESK